MNWYQKVKTQMSSSEIGILAVLLQKMIKGDRDWSFEELQLQSNFPKTIESILNDMMKQNKYDLKNLKAKHHGWFRHTIQDKNELI